jgi:hypothetical protein
MRVRHAPCVSFFAFVLVSGARGPRVACVCAVLRGPFVPWAQVRSVLAALLLVRLLYVAWRRVTKPTPTLIYSKQEGVVGAMVQACKRAFVSYKPTAWMLVSGAVLGPAAYRGVPCGGRREGRAAGASDAWRRWHPSPHPHPSMRPSSSSFSSSSSSLSSSERALPNIFCQHTEARSRG